MILLVYVRECAEIRITPYDGGGIVLRAVVNDDDLECRPTLIKDTLNRFRDILFAIINGYHGAEARLESGSVGVSHEVKIAYLRIQIIRMMIRRIKPL